MASSRRGIAAGKGATAVQVRLLGPVDVTIDGDVRPVSGLRRKATLAVLGLHPGQIVSTDRLIEVVWAGKAPQTVSNTLQSHISYLRRALGTGNAIVARQPGYALEIAGEATDVAVAERLIRDAADSTDDAHRAASLRAALDLWRGPSLVDVSGLAWLDEQAERLEHMRATALNSLLDARIALGEDTALVPDLEALTSAHPFDEHLHRQLMLVLYRAGRQSDALAVYQRLRRTLHEDLGIDPSPALRAMEAAILRHDADLDLRARATTTVASSGSVPAQLPVLVPAFAGRSDELSQLDKLLARSSGTQARERREGGVVICAVSGTPGVGKTALAVHWAHSVAEKFPDGQLYVNLRGYDPAGSVLDPAVAVRGFLDAFGVPAQRIPAGLDAQAALYRTLLAGKRVLIVLDNARDVEQVRMLLPGTEGCLVVVTSRDQLTGLIAAAGAQPLSLDRLNPDEAHELLAGRLGADRLAAEPTVVREIIARCAGLPLALAIIAARAVTRPSFPLRTLAAELRDEAGTLEALQLGDGVTDVRAVFSWSYNTLRAGAARLFRLLGLHPGPDFGVFAAASIAGIARDEARAWLAELTRASLLTEHAPGRYSFHDLLRAYAAEQAQRHDSTPARHAAMRRTVDHYLHTAHAGALFVEPGRDLVGVGEAEPGTTPEHLSGSEQALSWFAIEHQVLLALVQISHSFGCDARTTVLAWSLTPYFQRRGHWYDWATVQNAALDAARRLDDRAQLAQAHRGLGVSYSHLGRSEDAYIHYQQALALYGEVNDRTGQAQTHLNLAWVSERQNRRAEALEHAERALSLFRADQHRLGQARALNSFGWHHARLGNHREALAHCEQALTLNRDLGDREGEAWTLDSLGYAHHHLGEYQEAARCYTRSLTLIRDLADRYSEAEVLRHLADTHEAAGDPRAARQAWQSALDILEPMQHPDADEVRARLRAAAPAPTPRPRNDGTGGQRSRHQPADAAAPPR